MNFTVTHRVNHHDSLFLITSDYSRGRRKRQHYLSCALRRHPTCLHLIRFPPPQSTLLALHIRRRDYVDEYMHVSNRALQVIRLTRTILSNGDKSREKDVTS